MAAILYVAAMGSFMAALFDGKRTFLHPVIRPLKALTYKLIGVNERTEQHLIRRDRCCQPS